MTTVFLLDGLGYSGFLPLTKIVQNVGGTRIQVPYNNQVGNNLQAIEAARNTLDTYLNAYAGPKVVVGISMGTQVALKWQRDVTSSIPAGDLSFIHLASPENRFTGACVIAPKLWGPGYGGIGLPRKAKYPNTFFSRQFDGVCDYPNLPKANSTALMNALIGMGVIHINYFTVQLNDARNVTHTDPDGTKYIWSPTYPLPMVNAIASSFSSTNSAWQKLFPGRAAQKQRDQTFADDQKYRPQVESGYDRPVIIPDP